jgi:hypothetical protein
MISGIGINLFPQSKGNWGTLIGISSKELNKYSRRFLMIFSSEPVRQLNKKQLIIDS